MKKECEEIQVKIVTLGVAAASADAAVKHHLADCPLCGEFVNSAADLERAEEGLEEFDVPEDVFARTLSEVKKAQAAALRESAGSDSVGSRKRRGIFRYLFDPILAPALAVGLCGVLVLTLTLKSDRSIRKSSADAAPELPSPIVSDEARSNSQLEGAGGGKQRLEERIAAQQEAAPAKPNEIAKKESALSIPSAAGAPKMKADARMAQELADPSVADAEKDSLQRAPAPLREEGRMKGLETMTESSGVIGEQEGDLSMNAVAPAAELAVASSLQAAADAVSAGKFDEARALIEAIYPKVERKISLEAKSGDALILDTSAADRKSLLAALDAIQKPGGDSPAARAALRAAILASSSQPGRELRPALE